MGISINCASCTLIEVIGTEPKIEYVFGVPNIIVTADAGIKQYTIKSYGIGFSSEHASLGYYWKSFISIEEPSKCSLIIFIKDELMLDEIKRNVSNVGKDISEICIYHGE